MINIAILIPCYNEELTIAKVVADFRTAFATRSEFLSTIFVYDNNSSDNTAQVAGDAGAIVIKERRQGKGNVVRSQFRDIDADVYVMVDGDDTYEGTDALKLVDAVINERVDMCVGDRLSGAYFTENKRRFHGGGNVLVRKLINIFFKSEVHDIMTGYRAFSKRFVKTFPVLSRGFEIETEMTIHAVSNNLSITELPITYRDRPDGSESKLNTVSDGIKVISTIGRLIYEIRPLFFFTVLALISGLIGVGLAIIPLIEYTQTGLVLHFPTLIVSGFFILASLNIFVAGLILNLVQKKYRQQFEIELNRI